MKKDRKKKIDEEVVDISVIKENDLEETATFTDLLSRKERKKHKKDKDSTIEIEPIKEDSNEEDVDFQTEELAKQISENKTVEINEEDIKEIVNAKLDNEEEIIEEKEEKVFKNYFSIVLFTLFIISGISALIYGIIYTDFFKEDLYLLVDGAILILFVFNYCIMTISCKKTAIFFTIINYLLLIAAISFNILIYFKII